MGPRRSGRMIRVTRLNGTETVINAELIESVEATPDTVISLTTGHRYVVHESVDEVVARVLAYRLACCRVRERDRGEEDG